ncbi:MAG: glycosyltransferase family A protein [Elainellaceae cyanobacterium]
MPSVSIIIPAYNAEETILETIHSVREQTYQDFEILVIDDGSKDRTVEIVKEVDDPRIKVFTYPNGGVSVARNRGIERSTGEFLAFIDNDDLWTPDKLELQLHALDKNKDADAIYSWSVNMVDDGESRIFVSGSQPTATGNIYAELLLGNFIGNGSNILVRRKVIDEIGGYEPGLSFSDWDFCLRTAAKFQFAAVPKVQILYRRASGSMSSQVDAMEKAGLRALERNFASAPENYQHLKSKSLAFHYRYCADLALHHDSSMAEIKYAQSNLWKAIRLFPGLIFEGYAQKLIVKSIINRLLPRQLSRTLIQSFKTMFSQQDPRDASSS